MTFSLPLRAAPLSRAVSPHPFVPDDASQRTKRAELLLTMQAHGLRKHLAGGRIGWKMHPAGFFVKNLRSFCKVTLETLVS